MFDDINSQPETLDSVLEGFFNQALTLGGGPFYRAACQAAFKMKGCTAE